MLEDIKIKVSQNVQINCDRSGRAACFNREYTWEEHCLQINLQYYNKMVQNKYIIFIFTFILGTLSLTLYDFDKYKDTETHWTYSGRS